MGRPVNSRFFGSDTSANSATATYDTNGATAGAAPVDDPADITINITSGGSGYDEDFVVTVTDAGTGTFDVTFTVVDGVVTAGTPSNLSGTINDAQSGTAITMPESPSDFQILGTAYIPGSIAGAAESIFIVRQRSSRKYEVQSVANGDTGVCITANTGTPAEGELSIPVEPSDGAGGSTGTEYARIITNRRVRTFTPASYAWGDLTGDDIGEGLPGTDNTA